MQTNVTDAICQNLDYVRSMLCSRLAVTNTARQSYPFAFTSPDEVITSNRYILIIRGSLVYEIEGVQTTLSAGTLFFVPAWVRRHWKVSDRKGCENIWCEFSSLSLENGHHALFRATGIDTSVELGSLERMLAMWRKADRIPAYFPESGHSFIAEHAEDAVDLQLEGELKASLSRFWMHAVRDADNGKTSTQHPEIRKAVRLLEATFNHADALENLYKQIDLSGNHFRILFKNQMKTNPRDYLNSVRMRHARHLIHHSKRAIKDIAYSVGFNDPLHFSKQYSAFWGHFPTQDRHAIKNQIKH